MFSRSATVVLQFCVSRRAASSGKALGTCISLQRNASLACMRGRLRHLFRIQLLRGVHPRGKHGIPLVLIALRHRWQPSTSTPWALNDCYVLDCVSLYSAAAVWKSSHVRQRRDLALTGRISERMRSTLISACQSAFAVTDLVTERRWDTWAGFTRVS
ncbi:hypothetical protein EXIGLDRAFT_88303 [Exidia glandulosa HHB12029]|uniref:Uncharacterized protein n=1 Tax=Exidia glandulosa HHB12029 TaxID=1314781 RepID=A0A165NU01_EXIGL|nr:hypothetical protein EXIGLDRAFT_88303 [Exidia glandulosa HHB12029]